MRQKHILQWHLTHECNLRCKHCYQDDYSKDLKIEQLEDIFYQYLNYIKDNNYKGHINFTGGEPFIKREELFNLLNLCDKHNITYGILTNGTMINKELISEIKTLKNLRFIQMSLEGTQQVNDDIRGRGNYERVMKSVKLLNKAKIQTMISFTVHENNHKELRKLIWLCRLHGVKRFWTDRFIPIGGIDEYKYKEINIITTENYMKVIKIIGQEHKLNWLGMRVHTNRALQFMSGCGEFYECSAGNKLLTILADGTLLPCRRLPIELGNLTEENLSTILKDNETLKNINDCKLSKECQQCHLSKHCKGGAKCLTFALTGELNRKDINCPF